MADTADRDLIDLLTLFLASGKLNSVHVLPVLEQLAGKNVRDPSVTDLLDAVSQHPGPAFERLADHLSSSRFREAQQYHVSRKRNAAPSDEFQLMLGDLPLDAPLGWKTNKRTVASMSSLVVLARDRRYVVAQSNIAPITAAHVEQQYAAARREGLSL